MTRVHWSVLSCISLAWVALLLGCDSREKRLQEEQQLMERLIADRLDMIRRVRHEECERRLMDSAVYIVDSLRILEARLALDTMNRPYKPWRPENPGPGPSIDTLEIKPLIPDSVKNR